VDSLAFAPDGSLWGTTWPARGDVVRFDISKRLDNHPQQMLHFDDDVDSIAFGQQGTSLAGLLFVTHNDGPDSRAAGAAPPLNSDLTMVDLAPLQRIAVATGGTRGETLTTTADGRVLLCQSNQIDVLGPILAPHVVDTSPPADALAALPLEGIRVTFDNDMLADNPGDPHSVTNPANYQLVGDS